MKLKKVISFIVAFAILANLLWAGVVPTHAHEAMLEVSYDPCEEDQDLDSVNEAWYALVYKGECEHIGAEVQTIKYYFEEFSEGGTYTWTTNELITDEVAAAIKDAYASSMKKWNNVYFYAYDSEGRVVKRRIINIVEGTYEDHDISIYPAQKLGNVAETEPVGNGVSIETDSVNHKHFSEWLMRVNVELFCEETCNTTENVSSTVITLKERTGAHEIGHVLGLYDLDIICHYYIPEYVPSPDKQHHHELLMGYGEPQFRRGKNITYKDIAGVAITRGFHTDNDHLWIYCGMQNGNHKLLCSICNGVKTVSSLAGYTYEYYGDCLGNHNLSSGNMMAVASYETETESYDFYKCKYCKYVSSAKVEQEYSVPTSVNYTYHQYVNQVDGLEYTVIEEHNLLEDVCIVCGYVHTHSYGNGIYKNHSMHLARCECGATQMEPHYVRGSEIVNGRYATCLGCNRELDLLVDQAEIGIYSIVKVSVNGSYILDNGIVVLVDADVTAYLNGTLQFYEPDKLPSVA